MEQRGSTIVANLQALRLVAAALVLVTHLLVEAADFGFVEQPIAFAGGIGVDLFFIISGFVMMHNGGDSFGEPGASKRFLVRRLERIVPIYWIFTTLTLAVMIFASGAMRNNQVDPAHVLASYAFFPWLRADGSAAPVLGLGWTLNYEMFFYVLFAAALCLPRRIGLPALIGALTLLATLHGFVPESQAQLYFWTNPVILEFVAGILLALAWRAGWRVPIPVAAVAVVAVALVVPIEPNPRWLAWGSLAFVVVSAVALADQPSYASRIGRALLLGGDASYALYLSHPFSVNLVGIAVRKLGLGLGVYLVLSFVVSIVVAVLVHLGVERPILRLLRRGRARPAAPVEAPAE